MDNHKKIAPCPFSKRYYIDADHAWQSLTVFFLYRLTVGSVLLFLFFLGALPSSLGQFSPKLYTIMASLYLGSIFVSAMPMILRRPSFSLQAQVQILTDIALLPCIMHASGGIGSGVGVLLGLSVAAGGILVGGRCALGFAALASLAILGEELYADVNRLFGQTHFTYAGMLGASYFGIALLALVLAQRAERSEAIAEQRGADVANLQTLNAYIIQNLQSGILVVDEIHHIRLANESAVRLLGVAPHQRPLDSVCPELARCFRAWLAEPARNNAVVKTNGTATLQVRFTRLGLTRPPIHMIFLEDSTLHNERVQQSKLASLGRLTASIAHEIRNPLSAISHASQLLAEAPHIDGKDRRLIQIILDHVGRVNTVIENVLQISRRGEARRETIALGPALAKFLREFQMEQGTDPAQFRLESKTADPRVSVDPSHLKQILGNLCSNALKYGNPELGPISLRIHRRHGEPCVEVLDHAPVIDPGTAQNLFEPFFTTSSGGTGLGLYISRELAELNQARLEYADAGDGACFRLYLSDAEKTVVEL